MTPVVCGSPWRELTVCALAALCLADSGVARQIRETGVATTTAELGYTLGGLGVQSFDIPLAVPIDLNNVGLVVLSLLSLDAHWSASASGTVQSEHSFVLLSGGLPLTTTAVGATTFPLVSGSSFDTRAVFRTTVIPLEGAVGAADTLRLTIRNHRISGVSGSVTSTIGSVGGPLAVHAMYGGFGLTDANALSVEAPPTSFVLSSAMPRATYEFPWREFTFPAPIPASGLRAILPPSFAYTLAVPAMGATVQYALFPSDAQPIYLDDSASPGPNTPLQRSSSMTGFVLLDDETQASLANSLVTGWACRLVLRDVPAGGTTTFTMGSPRRLTMAFDDTDADAIWDRWEANGGGIDADGDGTIDLDLWARGASPNRPDVFVEVDSMAERGPSPVALEMVRNAFFGAPFPGGIGLHCQMDGDQDIPRAPWISPSQWLAFDRVKNGFGTQGARFGTPAERADPNSQALLAAKRLVYRYCIFADRYFDYDTVHGVPNFTTRAGQTSGYNTNDFFVSLGGVAQGSDTVKAAVFMHELGHTLGLTHGGSYEERNDSFKPNYFSIMNYSWLFPARHPDIAQWWRLDYSRSEWALLNEFALLEANGVAAPVGVAVPAGLRVPFTDGAGRRRLARIEPHAYADWSGDRALTPGEVAVDVNHDPRTLAPSLGVIRGHDDWSNLRFNFRRSIRYLTGAVPTELPMEITGGLAEYLVSWPGPCDADVNLDGVVDFLDLNAVLSDYGTSGAGLSGDVNADGVVDFLDLNELLSAYGSPC